ncbi:hypothetical protein LOKVESSMR4R_00374 [Yoonia vestfoldensis]|uniref:Uncharacterized protein n=1 Tax=Yoonia vestfoldensis TaxID=245188 RepID=A0A1Y0E7Y0_9RHOB|nr:hypothetical protein LOKVESSMR4R_00374 [Yoonia vestfoldensis]
MCIFILPVNKAASEHLQASVTLLAGNAVATPAMRACQSNFYI